MLVRCLADDFWCLALRKMPFRNAKDAYRQDDSLPFVSRFGMFRGAKDG